MCSRENDGAKGASLFAAIAYEATLEEAEPGYKSDLLELFREHGISMLYSPKKTIGEGRHEGVDVTVDEQS